MKAKPLPDGPLEQRGSDDRHGRPEDQGGERWQAPGGDRCDQRAQIRPAP